MEKSFANKVWKMSKGKCPNCGEGDIYQQKYKTWIHLPKMKDHCEVCHYDFHGEPGYFLGAMYVSYGLAVLEGIIAFLIASFFIKEFSGLMLASIVTGVIVLFSIPNFKISRVVWMYLFPYSR
ncbi:MAG: DUF983 domain-containing protein [Bacteroidota bacterium]